MNRPLVLCFALALSGLACDPSIVAESSSSISSGETSSDNATAGPSGGGGGGQSASSSGGGGSISSTTGSGGDPGPCVEDGPFPMAPGGGTGIAPSKCHCEEEALTVLPLLASSAKAHHDSSGSSCGTAFPVPGVPPPNTYYMPASSEGSDFKAGDEDHGWSCLAPTMPAPIHCQFHYTKGAAPVSTNAGGPGVAGDQDFEVAAQGDADGDGTTSTFSIRGVIGADGEMVIQPIFQHQPEE